MRVALAVLAVLTATCAMEPSSAEQGALGDPNVRAKLHDLALEVSSVSGVPAPRTIIAVASPDHQAAEQIISGAIINDHAPVYVVEMTGGRFTSAHAAQGVDPPTGAVLTLTVDARTFDVTDSGITEVAPDLTLISPKVVNLLAE